MSVSLYTVHIILKTESKILGRDFDFRLCRISKLTQLGSLDIFQQPSIALYIFTPVNFSTVCWHKTRFEKRQET